jgi:large subunit ribosomal protein L9
MPRPKNGFSLDRKQVALSRPIKELGLHTVHVNLHPEVDVDIVLNVARSPEEAELQASGKSIQELAAEEEAAAEFEIAELFDDIGAAQLDDFDDGAAPASEDGCRSGARRGRQRRLSGTGSAPPHATANM